MQNIKEGNTVGSQRNLTHRQQKLLIGILLGDGCLEKNGNNVRLRIEHGVSQREYLQWKYEEFRSLSPSPPRLVIQKDRRRGKIYKKWHFSTYSLPELTSIWRRWYSHGRKKLPEDIINEFCSPLSLAVWIMDDGYRRNDCRAMRINCEAFTMAEQKVLQKCLKRNFQLVSSLHKKGKFWNIYIPASEFKKLVELIKPHLHQSMVYKVRFL